MLKIFLVSGFSSALFCTVGFPDKYQLNRHWYFGYFVCILFSCCQKILLICHTLLQTDGIEMALIIQVVNASTKLAILVVYNSGDTWSFSSKNEMFLFIGKCLLVSCRKA